MLLGGYKSISEPDDKLKINLKWIKSHKNESLEDLIKGFQWSMAFAGAKLPSESFKKAFILKENDIFEVNFKHLGFDKTSLNAWQKLIKYTKGTPSYKKNQSIDLSRFLVFSVYSSWHYYQIVGLNDISPDSLKSIISAKQYSTFPVMNSCVTDGHRLIKYLIKNEVIYSKFVAIEGAGNLLDSTFQTDRFETIDLMKNGQLRYAIYSPDGSLIDALPKKFGRAGKPAKCMWCHEGNIAPLFTANTVVEGFKKPKEFSDEMLRFQQNLNTFRDLQQTAIQFKKHEEHQLSEVLYISFMSPSAWRLAQEWNISESEVKQKLKGFHTHQHHEFSLLGELYDRNDAELFAPFNSLPVPSSVREPNSKEPNIFR
jgi:hypothetical protein